MQNLSEAWERAQRNVQKAQRKQQKYHDKRVRMPKFAVGGRVFVYKPSTKTGKAYKFAKPFHGPYRILTLHEGAADVVLIERPEEASIRVPFERLRVCPEEIPESSPPAQDVAAESALSAPPTNTTTSAPPASNSVWTGRLRKRNKK